MVRMGVQEGEVMQHSMLTSSIERAQRKVEENNFGIRKRLLEYDDVMNSQRTVIYAKRKNALFGERLDVDVNNIIYDVAEDLVTEFKQGGGTYEEFELESLRLLSVKPEFTAEEFTNKNIATLTEQYFQQLNTFYKNKIQRVAQAVLPILIEVKETRGHMFDNVAIPFTDGKRGIQITADLNKVLATEGAEVFRSFEKGIILGLIDESWKEHLREMDDLKQSVQNAVYEQKDPVIIYKMEAYNLFKDMLSNLNKETISFLFKGEIPTPDPAQIQEAQRAAAQRPAPKVEEKKDDFPSQTASPGMEDTREIEKTQPVRVENRIGRNDPCPCGSGKKYKSCHGQI